MLRRKTLFQRLLRRLVCALFPVEGLSNAYKNARQCCNAQADAYNGTVSSVGFPFLRIKDKVIAAILFSGTCLTYLLLGASQ